jgi:hypothetical protein
MTITAAGALDALRKALGPSTVQLEEAEILQEPPYNVMIALPSFGGVAGST